MYWPEWLNLNDGMQIYCERRWGSEPPTIGWKLQENSWQAFMHFTPWQTFQEKPAQKQRPVHYLFTFARWVEKKIDPLFERFIHILTHNMFLSGILDSKPVSVNDISATFTDGSRSIPVVNHGSRLNAFTSSSLYCWKSYSLHVCERFTALYFSDKTRSSSPLGYCFVF